MTATLTPINVEVKKYLNLSKTVLADILNWDRFSSSYQDCNVTHVAVHHDIVQIFLTDGMVPLGTWQVDQFLEERDYIPVERKVISSPDDPIEVVWEDCTKGYTRNKKSGKCYRFWYEDSRIYGKSPGSRYRGTDKHYRAVLESLGQRPGSYQMEF